MVLHTANQTVTLGRTRVTQRNDNFVPVIEQDCMLVTKTGCFDSTLISDLMIIGQPDDASAVIIPTVLMVAHKSSLVSYNYATKGATNRVHTIIFTVAKWVDK